LPKSKYPTYERAGTAIRSLPFALAVALLALLPFAGPVQAHGEQFARAEGIWPVLDEEQPEELEGVTLRMETNFLGRWLVAENDTGEPLEIYDTEGEPFLRVGPEGVEYNRFAEEYYLTKPERESPPKEVRDNPDAEPEWVPLADEWIPPADKPYVLWKDRRIDTEGMEVSEWVPMEVRQAREDAEIGEWSIPVRLGEAETEVRGTYHYDAPPRGDFAARVTSEPESSEITVEVLHGAAKVAEDALFLQNASGEPVTIFGRSGEPAIRIGPEESQINVNSPLGLEAGRRDPSGVEEPLETAQPEWEMVSGGSSFSWLDPRLRPPEGQPEPDDSESVQEVAQWEIPMQVGGEEVRIAGVIEWQPSDWQPPEESADTSGTADGIGFRQVATVGAVTVVPAVAILALLLGPGLYKRYRYRR
jgi:hypothetical protein